MNNGLGFVCLVLAPLFGIWEYGAAVGLLIVVVKHVLAKQQPPDYFFFFSNGLASCVAVIEGGLLAMIHVHREMIDQVRYAFITGGLSAAVWVLWAVVACLPSLVNAPKRKWILRITLLCCAVMALPIVAAAARAWNRG
jgi:hypothetical protein